MMLSRRRLLAALLLPAGAAKPAEGAELAEGVVRSVDKDAGTVTIRHGELKSVGMGAMTMVFQVRDKTWLDDLKPGDKLRFDVVEEAGQYVVTVLHVVR